MSVLASERTHTIYAVFHSREIYDVPQVLIADARDARSFQALAAILDSVTQLASMLRWHGSQAALL